MTINPITNIHTNTTYQPTATKQEPSSKTKKAVVLAGSALGTMVSLGIMGKRQGLNVLKPKDYKKFNIGTQELLFIPLGSILGGLVSGNIIDKQNKHAKEKEAMQQYIGNIIFPVSFVTGANALYNKISDKIKLPTFNNKVANAVTKAAPVTAVTLASLGTGVFVGNKFMNAINKKLNPKSEEREVKVTDFSAHLDDLLLGATLVAQNLSKDSSSTLGTTISRFIPPALVIQGYMTGMATEENKH